MKFCSLRVGGMAMCSRFAFAFVSAALLSAAACTGRVAGGSGDDPQNDRGKEDEGVGGVAGDNGRDTAPVELGGLSIRRLTRWEYQNTIKDLLDAPASYATAYSNDDVGKAGFATAINTSELMATSAMESAEALSRFALTRLGALSGCAASASDDCAQEFIESFGQRAFRRPLMTTERRDLFGVFAFARKDLGFDFPNSIRTVLSAMLQAPQFLYHWERGEEDVVSDAPGTVRLGQYQIAARLSYFLWGSMPDAALFLAAREGKLRNSDQLEAQARRMLGDQRSRAMVADFFTQLLYLDTVLRADKDQMGHPEWTAALRTSALNESRRFVQDVVLDGDGLWSTILTAKHSWVDESLAKVYGIEGTKGPAFVRVTLPGNQRTGILTQAAFLAGHAGPAEGALVTPIHRGEKIRKRLLCQPIPPPLENIVSRGSTGTTTRERLKSHVADPKCATCHVLMDDLGFAFENYDVTGKWRTLDNGETVDASGEISGLRNSPPKFNNAIELANVLATTDEATECMAANLLRYGLGRLDTEGEAQALLQTLDGSQLNVRDAMVRVVTSRGFSQRTLSQGEVLP